MEKSKAEWRARLLDVRRAVDPGARRAASAAVVQRVAALPAFGRARSVLLYVAMGGELDPRALALHALGAGRQIYLPASMQVPTAWSRVSEADLTVRSGDAATTDVPVAPVVVIAPGVGFDLLGTRLGRGAGYYDQSIAALRRAGDTVVIGIGYDAQVVERLPRDPWDQAVDAVVTELRVLAPNSPAEGADHGRLEVT